MKKKSLELLVVLIILFIYLGIFLNPTLIIESGVNSINIFKTKLFPSIFPFFVLAYLLLDLGIANKISIKLNPIIKKLYHVDGICSFLILVSIISGFPSGSKYIETTYKDGKIPKDVANYLLTFTHFANPLFVLGTCSIILDSKIVAEKIFISQLFANLILGIIIRPKRIVKSFNLNDKGNDVSLLLSLSNAINEAVKLLLFMLGSITFFMFFSKLTVVFFSLNNFFSTIITGLLDLTSGIASIKNLGISVMLKGLVALSFITFGSMSVHIQVINNLRGSDLSYSYFFIGRIIQTAIAILIYLLL